MNSSSRSEWIRSVLAQYEDPLTRYAASITGDIERARDVVQDTFLRLCSQKPSRVRDHLAQWLFTVCRNRAVDVRRKESRMSSTIEVQLEAQPTQEPEPSKVLEQKEQLSQVLRILETLPSNQQEVIRLKFQSGLSYREISHVTELSVSNVGFLIHTGLKTVRQKLNAQSRSSSALLRRVK
ncbi:sigma-70 family RNA polymerase sigma factor [Acidobacteria bacterium AH-259-G07]|nr:sigma-70 family RNA polymerase sigma factor [Acidobacteria bacterium AH-259-G07]